MNRVFRVQVEVAHMEGSTLPADWQGAYVNVYTTATNLKEAIEIAEGSLRSDKYDPIDTYSAHEIDVEEYDPSPEEYDETLEKESMQTLQKVGGLLYSAFFGFHADEDDTH